MPRVLDELRRDHRNMAKILAILDAQLKLFRAGEPPDLDVMQRAMDYSLDYPDLCHHPKEDLIFERLARRDPSVQPLVDRLLQEHREIGQATRRFADAVRVVAQDFQVPRDRFIEIGEAYLALSRRHIQQEEAELFPRADRILDDSDWAEIDAAAARKPDPVFGGTVEDRYLALHARIVELSG